MTSIRSDYRVGHTRTAEAELLWIIDPSPLGMTSGLARPHEDLQGLEKARLDIAARERVAASKSGEETQNLTKELTLTTRRGDGDLAPFPKSHLARSHGRPQVSGTRAHGLYRPRLMVPAHSDGDARRPEGSRAERRPVGEGGFRGSHCSERVWRRDRRTSM
jgi:hypothetical protein